MDSLPSELCVVILAFLPSFTDRWNAKQVNKQLWAAQRILSQPSNDGLASEHLSLDAFPHYDTPIEKSYGPTCRFKVLDFVFTKKQTLCILEFHFQGETIVSPMCSEEIGSIVFESDDPRIYFEDFSLYGSMRVMSSCNNATFAFTVPLRPGEKDIFDRVPFGILECKRYLVPDPSVSLLSAFAESLRFNVAVARRLHHYPFFARLRDRADEVALLGLPNIKVESYAPFLYDEVNVMNIDT